MVRSIFIALLLLTALLTPAPMMPALVTPGLVTVAMADEHPRCLSRAEQRAAIADGQAVPLAVARRMLRQRTGGELVRARLCHDSGRLIYLLTVLARDGKVVRVTVDATNGTVISGL
jgi:uncharacterized membrane protein YkoI